jgi:hypothetical protein
MCRWQIEPKRLSSLGVNHQLKFCRKLIWKFDDFATLDNQAGVHANLSVGIGKICAVAEKGAGIFVFAPGRRPMPGSQRDDLLAAVGKKNIGANEYPADLHLD